MKKFVFITALTPKEFLSPLRASLFELYVNALKNQTYSNWEALLIGEEDKKDGKLTYLKSEAVSKTDKLKFAYQYLCNLSVKPDCIIRLDDDDIISPFVLNRIANMNFDCYSDLYHTFYDLTTGTTNQQKRDWLPNTIIHKYEHAMAPYGESQMPLFSQDHSKTWHEYYKNKNVVYAAKTETVYLRILSPTTITSRLGTSKEGTLQEIDLSEYKKYLIPFGKFLKFGSPDFKQYHDKLIKIWEDFSGKKIVFKKSFFDIFK